MTSAAAGSSPATSGMPTSMKARPAAISISRSRSMSSWRAGRIVVTLRT
jgi:hypothetical protein